MIQNISNRTLLNTVVINGFVFLLLHYNSVDMHIPLKMLLYVFTLGIINLCFFHNEKLIVNVSDYSFKSYANVYASLTSIWFTMYFLKLISEFEVPNNFAIMFMYSICLGATYWIFRLFNEMFSLFSDYNPKEKHDDKIHINNYYHMNETEVQCEYNSLIKEENYEEAEKVNKVLQRKFNNN